MPNVLEKVYQQFLGRELLCQIRFSGRFFLMARKLIYAWFITVLSITYKMISIQNMHDSKGLKGSNFDRTANTFLPLWLFLNAQARSYMCQITNFKQWLHRLMIKDGGVLTTCQVFLLKALKTVQPLQALNSQSRWLVVVVVQYPCYKIFKIVVVVLVGSQMAQAFTTLLLPLVKQMWKNTLN